MGPLPSEVMRLPLVWARVVRPWPPGAGTLHRAGYLTPYLVQTIAEDVRRGGRVEIEVAADVDDAGLQWVRGCCARLRSARIHVVWRRARRAAAA